MSDTSTHHFTLRAAFRPEDREGTLESGSKSFHLAHTGAPSLGGKEGVPNPEELLLAAVGSCFVQTWAIFLGKLQVPITHPEVRLQGELEKDPEGGFRMAHIRIEPQVAARVWATHQAGVEKTLHLAEKYCIVSKAVRGDGSVVSVQARVA